MKKFALISLALILVLALALPTLAIEPEDEGDIICAWGTPTIDCVKDDLYNNADHVELIFKDENLGSEWSGDQRPHGDLYFANDDDYFYVFADVIDTTYYCHESLNWAEDCFEIVMHEYGTGETCKLHFTRSHPTGGVVASAGENFQYVDIDFEEEVIMKVINTDIGYTVEAAIPMDWNPVYNPDGSVSDEIAAHIAFQVFDVSSQDFNPKSINYQNNPWYVDQPMAAKGVGGRMADDGGMYLVFAEEPEETAAPETQAPAEETQAPAEETQAPAEETQAPTEETQAPAIETEAPSDDPSPVTADIAVIAAGVALAAAAVVIFKKH